ncbi:MAG TPA: hypothetical protein VGZ47_15395 [Gemmataceae bacterium]|jgi:hypothetical protein|nr:hypothetical protein [Gemmataceae bacterium]
MIRKLFGWVLALTILVSGAAPVFAVDPPGKTSSSQVEKGKKKKKKKGKKKDKKKGKKKKKAAQRLG